MLLRPFRLHEVRKFLPLNVILFLICFNYSVLKAAKDALMITAPGSGAEAIPFMKIWIVFPVALGITYLFNRLFNRYSQQKTFCIIIGIFLAFFVLFAYVLYPHRDAIHPHRLGVGLQEMLPGGCHGFVAIIRNWSYALFYVMAELWTTIIMSLAFWGFANSVISVDEAKKHYGILGVSANIGTLCAGYATANLSAYVFGWVNGDHWGRYLETITVIVVCVGLCTVMMFYRYYRGFIVRHVKTRDPFFEQGNGAGKKKLGVRKNFSYFKKSKYLICIAVLVMGFNFTINITEVIWKGQIKLLYPHPEGYNRYMGEVLIANGWLSTIAGLFLCNRLIRRFGWTFGALTTPVAVFVTGICFFGFILYKDSALLVRWTAMVGSNPLTMCVLFGSVHNVLSRSCKYSFFDATKEIAFIPLSAESQVKGKAVIDGLGSRIGKSGSSLLQSLLLVAFGSMADATPWSGLILLAAVLCWMVAARSLGRRFDRLVHPVREGEGCRNRDLEAVRG